MASSTPSPSIAELLFGETEKCPKFKKKCGEDGPLSPASPDSRPYDSLGLGDHWGVAAKEHDINLPRLRRACSQGIADEGSHRGVAWRVLVQYLNAENIHQSWPQMVPPQRDLYSQLVQQYIDGPLERGKDLRGSLSKLLRDRNLRKKYNKAESMRDDDSEKGDYNSDDNSAMSEQTLESNVSAHVFTHANKIVDRLPTKYQDRWKKAGIDLDNKNSDFNSQVVRLGINQLRIQPNMTEEAFEEFLEDAQQLAEIRKDVARTHPDLFFYLEPKDHLGMRRYGALERILFIWSKLNKGVRYVQGMNEIIGTIYYVLANDHNSDWANHAEVDSYFVFHSLMMDIRDLFVPDMDATHNGIQGRLANLQRLLKTHDPEVHGHLQEIGIDASFFAIRWLTTLLSREFLLPDTIRMWDSMFASTHKENFLRYVCGTMVIMVRDDLLRGDFGQCLRLLQSYPPGDVDTILIASRSLWMYESQIRLACHKGRISLHQALQTISPPQSIVMAFGMHGGVAPFTSTTFGGFVDTTAQATQSQGLFGRVKRLWSSQGQIITNDERTIADESPTNNNSKNDETQSITTTNTMTTIMTEATEMTSATEMTASTTISVPPVSRIWNRGRGNTFDGNIESSSSNEEITKYSTTTSAPPVSRIWNRGRGNTFDGNIESSSSNEEVAKSKRRQIWNRGGSGGSNRSDQNLYDLG